MADLMSRWRSHLVSWSPTRWLARRPWTLAMVTWVALAVPGFVVVSNNNSRTDEFVRCLTAWADESADRTHALTTIRKPLDDAERAILLAAAHADRDGLLKSLADYETAANAYDTSLREHPVPDAPRLRCRS